MLAVFNNSVAKCPDALKNSSGSGSGSGAESEASSALKDGSLLRYFCSVNPEAVTVNLGPKGFMTFSTQSRGARFPRQFASADEMFCMFQGSLYNVAYLRQLYGIAKFTDECSIIVESYRSLQRLKKAPIPPHKVMSFIEGKFAFVVYDNTSKSTLIGVDADGTLPLYWGADAEDSIVLSTDIEMVKKVCGKSLGPFPKGCFFSSSDGLECFEHPGSVLNAVPWEDASKQSSGVAFVVAKDGKKKAKPQKHLATSDSD